MNIEHLNETEKGLCLSLALACANESQKGSGMAFATRNVLTAAMDTALEGNNNMELVQPMLSLFAQSIAGQLTIPAGLSGAIKDLKKTSDLYAVENATLEGMPSNHVNKRKTQNAIVESLFLTMQDSMEKVDTLTNEHEGNIPKLVTAAFKGFRTESKRYLDSLDSGLVLTVSGGQAMEKKAFVLETANQRDQRKEVKALENLEKQAEKQGEAYDALHGAAIAENEARTVAKDAEGYAKVAAVNAHNVAVDASYTAVDALKKADEKSKLFEQRADAAMGKVDGITISTPSKMDEIDTVSTIKALMVDLSPLQLQELADYATDIIPVAEQKLADAMTAIMKLKAG